MIQSNEDSKPYKPRLRRRLYLSTDKIVTKIVKPFLSDAMKRQVERKGGYLRYRRLHKIIRGHAASVRNK